LLAFGWQTVKLRRVLAYPEAQTDGEGFSFTRWLGNRFSKTPRKPTPPAVPQEVKTQEEVVEVKEEATREEAVAPAKPGLLSNILGSRKPPAEAKPTSLTTALDGAEATEEFEEDWESEAVSETGAIASDAPSVSGETAEPVIEMGIVEETEAVESVVVEAETSSEVETDETAIIEETEAVESVVVEAETSGNEPATGEAITTEKTEPQN
jgi:hypothetical protein